MKRGAALIGALLVTLATPATWVTALAVFLIRGGFLLVLLPVVVLPSVVGVGNVLAPALTSIAFGSITTEWLAVAVMIVIVVLAWLLLGGWFAATLEAAAVRLVAADDDAVQLVIGPPVIRDAAPRRGRETGRILAARVLAYLPFGLALVVGSVRLVSVAYRELTSPIDVATPVLLRVVRASPEVIVALLLTWMVGEILSALAARRIVLAGDGVLAALRAAVVTILRHPLSTLTRFWIPTFVLVAVLLPSMLAASAAWGGLRGVLGQWDDPAAVLLGVVQFVGLWAIGLLLVAVVCAWRAAIWTVSAGAIRHPWRAADV